MQYKNFFWDFDGTLYATYGRITRACLKALADAGKDIRDISFEDAYRAAKRSIKNFSDRYAAPLGIPHDDFMAGYRAKANLEGEESIRP